MLEDLRDERLFEKVVYEIKGAIQRNELKRRGTLFSGTGLGMILC
jgi:hypothetical protein